MDLSLTPLHALAELDQFILDSHVTPVMLFKHSYTCGVSAEAMDELRAYLDDHPATARRVRYAMVTVQTHRDISNAIASKLGVRHETPQAILVHEGRAVWTASHFRVNAAELQKALESSFRLKSESPSA
jgi:bacillithiol system protein YtxJ